MPYQLPSPWLQNVAGARGFFYGSTLHLELPAALVPLRRYATFHAVLDAADQVVLSIIHEEEYTGPVTGRNAWQTTSTINRFTDPQVADNPYPTPTRTLQKSKARITGDPKAVDKLYALLRTMGEQPLVRATPEGFELLFGHPGQLKGFGVHYSSMIEKDLAGVLRAHPIHGSHSEGRISFETVMKKAREAKAKLSPEWYRRLLTMFINTSPRVAPRFSQLRPIHYRAFITQANKLLGHLEELPNHSSLTTLNLCKCQSNQETEDMKNIDTTTSSDLPFGLVAGEKIVQCQFSDNGSKSYAYFAGSLDLVAGDYAIVASPFGGGYNNEGAIFDEESGGYLKVVRVTDVDLNAEGVRKAAKWIIAKVDIADYRERRAKLEQLRTLDEQIKIAEKEARAKLEMEKLRDLSPELAALIDARKAITG